MNPFTGNKVLYHPELIGKWVMGKQVYPVKIEIESAAHCNHHCWWCNIRRDGKPVQLLKKETMFSLIREVKELGTKALLWIGGGEPLLCPWAIDGMRLADELGFEQGIVTNGELITDEIADFMAQKFVFVRISLDAGTAESYARLHAPARKDIDVFSKVLGNMQKLVDAKKKHKSATTLGCSYLIQDDNLDDLYGLAKQVKQIGLNYVQAKPIIEEHNQKPKAWFDNAMNIINTAKELNDEHFSVISTDHRIEDLGSEESDFNRNYKKCHGAPLLTVVGADGYIYTCCHFLGHPDFRLGNLNEKSFKECWQNVEENPVLKDLDIKVCPPGCKLHGMNKVLEEIKNPPEHHNFL